MRRRRALANRVKIHHNYTIEEVADLLAAHPNTIRRWIVRDGLLVLADRKPHLVLGRELHFFLSQPSPGAVHLKPGECYCVKCHAARLPALAMADYVPVNERFGNLRGFCPVCETLMHRRVSLAKLPFVALNMQVTILQVQPRIDERRSSCTNDDLRREPHGQGKPLRKK